LLMQARFVGGRRAPQLSRRRSTRCVVTVQARAGGPHTRRPLRIEAPGRIVALGDCHGDLVQTQKALITAGVLEPETDRWCGGDTHLVQLGDLLDRGNEEIALMALFARLREEARQAGGDVHVLVGNHEVMNVQGDFRYVTEGALRESARFHAALFEEFGEGAAEAMPDVVVRRGGAGMRRRLGPIGLGEAAAAKAETLCNARAALFSPGGPMARALAECSVALVVNDTLFVHGGPSLEALRFGLGKLNDAVRTWMLGGGGAGTGADDPARAEYLRALSLAMQGPDSLVWNRLVGRESLALEKAAAESAMLATALGYVQQEVGLPVRRVVVGHTVQSQGPNCACNGTVWRIDCGLSRGVRGATPALLEIDSQSVCRVLTAERPATPHFLDMFDAPDMLDIPFEPESCDLAAHASLLRSPLPIPVNSS